MTPTIQSLLEAIETRYGLRLGERERDAVAEAVAAGEAPDDAIERIVIGETSFFRHAAHFTALSEVVLPERIAARAGAPVRILSAGCSCGAEPASIAILAREAFPHLDPAAFEVVGVDVSADAIRRARAGVYTPWQLRHVPPPSLRRWFSPAGPNHVLAAPIRSAVTYRRANLLRPGSDVLRPGSWDVIVCRNVLIHLTAAARDTLIDALAAALKPGGFLLPGPSDIIGRRPDGLVAVRTTGAIFFRSGGVPEAPRRSRAVRSDAPSRPRERKPRLAPHSAPDRVERPFTVAPSPPPAPAPTRRSDDATIGAAIAHIAADRPEEALRCLPDETPLPAFAVVRALALVKLGRLDAAEAACWWALDRDPVLEEAHHVLSVSRAARDDLGGARDHSRVALYLDPGFAMAHLHAATVLQRCGEAAAARRHLARTSELLPLESDRRIRLYGGGFHREALAQLCRRRLDVELR